MIAFCTHCWSEIDADLEQCPHCATDLRKDHRSYEKKLIAALAHPLPEARARICWLIGRNGIRTAVPRLMQMVKRDQDSFVRRAAVEALGSLQDPCAITLLHAISEGTDRFLAGTAKNSLTRIGSPRDAG